MLKCSAGSQLHIAASRAVAILVVAASPAIAQRTITISDVSPNQSTLDASDPDGASGGRVTALSRATPNTFFAASEWGGIWKSTDTGRTWSQLHNHLPLATYDVEAAPNNADKIYATSLYDGRVTSLAGINVSADGGSTWTHPASVTPPAGTCLNANARQQPSAFGISIDPRHPDVVVIGTNCGVARSTDAGVTWTFVDPTPATLAANVWDVLVHDDSIIDICGNDGHLRSTNGGTTWRAPTSNPLPAGRCSLAVSPDESNVLFAVVGTQIFESDDGGLTWPNALVNPFPQGRIPFVATNQRTGASFDLWFGDVSLVRATCTTPNPPANGGAVRCPANTWSARFTRSVGAHDDLGDIVFDGAANNACPVMMSSDGGVFFNLQTASPACQSPTWEQPNVTPHALWVFATGGADQPGVTAEDMYFGAQDNGTFATQDFGNPLPAWANRDCCDSFSMAASSARVLYSMCCFAGTTRFFLRNPGMTGGAQINTNPPGTPRSFRPVPNIAVFGPDDFAVVTSSGVFITQDITASPIVWTQLGATPPANAMGVYVAMTGTVPTFFAHTGSANGAGPDAIFSFAGTSSTGNWTQINPPGGIGGFGVFAVDPRNPLHLIASHIRPGSTPQMVMSSDGGANWTVLTQLDALMTGSGTFRYNTATGSGPTDFLGFNGYPQPMLVAFDPVNSNRIVAGAADAGIFLSFDGGTTWQLVTDPNDPVDSGKPHIPRPRHAYFDHEPWGVINKTTTIGITTQGRGVWKVRINDHLDLPIFCRLSRIICRRPILDRALLILDCNFQTNCIIRDPVPRNCLIKFECPGCQHGLCPPWYHFVLDDFDPQRWDVDLVTSRGVSVPHSVYRKGNRMVVSFRPSRAMYRPGRIGDFELLFSPAQGVKPQRTRVKASLQVGDGPFETDTRTPR